jgi:hypothetical protein
MSKAAFMLLYPLVPGFEKKQLLTELSALVTDIFLTIPCNVHRVYAKPL